jgi:hypothetical protein
VKSFPAFGILFGSRERLPELKALLEKNSGLPGPRGNLELAHSFAASVAAMHLAEWQWEFLTATASMSPNKAAANTSREFLPFCATLALGALYANGLPRTRRRPALTAFAAAAEDPRWRMREACAMSLQLIGEKDSDALKEVIAAWLPGASYLTLRAIAAALAHPPILKDTAFAQYTMETARTLVAALSRAEAKARGSESFKTFRQGLGYALSVFVAALPGEGFALLRKTAALRDPDVAWVVKENLKKKRISDEWPKECADVMSTLTASQPMPPRRV